MTDPARKSPSQIREEWAAIETKRPGGSLPNVAHLLHAAEALEVPPRERHLIDIIRTLHDTVQAYHAEMGVLLAAPPEGQPARHQGSGKTYRVLGPGKHKHDGVWHDVVRYANAQGEHFSRTVPDFQGSFDLFTPEQVIKLSARSQS